MTGQHALLGEKMKILLVDDDDALRSLASVDNSCASTSRMVGRPPRDYCSFAYSALASFRMGMSGSASCQSARKSLYAVRALAVSPCNA